MGLRPLAPTVDSSRLGPVCNGSDATFDELLRLHDQAIDLEAFELAAGLGGRRRVEARIARAKERASAPAAPAASRGCGCQRGRARARAPTPAGARPRLALEGADLDLEGAAHRRRRRRRCRGRRVPGRGTRLAGQRCGRRRCGNRRLAARQLGGLLLEVEGGAPRTTVMSENSAGLSDGAAGGVAGASLARPWSTGRRAADAAADSVRAGSRCSGAGWAARARSSAARQGPSARARSRRPGA